MNFSRPARTRSNGGFTLLELLVVMVIMGFMAAMAVPRIGNSLVNLQLKTVARKISASLRYARNCAVSEKRRYTVEFDGERRRLTISSENQSAAAGSLPTEKRPQGEKWEKTYVLPETVRVEDVVVEGEKREWGPFAFLFFPNGCSNGGGFLLTNDRGRQFRVSIDFVTGTVRLSDGPENFS